MEKVVRSTVLYALLILISVISIFPLLWGLGASFRSDVEIFKYASPVTIHTFVPVEFTLDAYVQLFTKYHFFNAIINTLIVTFTTIFFGCIINSVTAFAFTTFNFKGKSILFTIMLLSFMIPFESTALPLYVVVDRFGWVDTYAGLITPGIADGMIIFLFIQFFKEIPISLLEAARVDGASWRTIFIKILAPLSRPVFITAALMFFMGQWNSYLWPLLVGRSRTVQMVQIALGEFQQEHQTLWSLIYAGSMVSAVIPLILFLPFQRYFVEGIVSGGVKG